MKYYEGLMNQLKRGVISSVYLFYGEEEYLKQQAVSKFKEYLLPQGADFNTDILEGENAVAGGVISLASTPPFMAEHRLVIVKDSPWFMALKRKSSKADEEEEEQENDYEKEETEKGKAKLEDALIIKYLNQPLKTSCLIFLAGENIDRRRKIFKQVEKVGQVVHFVKLKQGELEIWLETQAHLAGKKLENQAKELLSGLNSLGLTGLVSEWQKILTYVGEKEEITYQDVMTVVHRSAEFRIFDVMDDIGEKKYYQALNGVKELLANKEKPLLILTMIVRQFRLMLQVKELSAYYRSYNEIAREINENPYPVKKALNLNRNFSQKQLFFAMSFLAQLDTDMKLGRQELYAGLERLFLNLS